MKQQDYELWTEYAATMNRTTCRRITQAELWQNLENARQKRLQDTIDQGKFFVNCPVKAWEQKLALIATTNCKSRQEWQNDDARDMRMLATGVMSHKSAGELLEHYQDKTQSLYHTERLYERQITECQNMITGLKQQIRELEPTNRKRALRSAQNKLNHWQARLAGLQCDLMRHQRKERRIEQKSMKWLGITEKIKTADIAREIKQEKGGIGNKYGFNPKAQSRETAEIMFED